jgi:hypothetical protein
VLLMVLCYAACIISQNGVMLHERLAEQGKNALVGLVRLCEHGLTCLGKNVVVDGVLKSVLNGTKCRSLCRYGGDRVCNRVLLYELRVIRRPFVLRNP